MNGGKTKNKMKTEQNTRTVVVHAQFGRELVKHGPAGHPVALPVRWRRVLASGRSAVPGGPTVGEDDGGDGRGSGGGEGHDGYLRLHEVPQHEDEDDDGDEEDGAEAVARGGSTAAAAVPRRAGPSAEGRHAPRFLLVEPPAAPSTATAAAGGTDGAASYGGTGYPPVLFKGEGFSRCPFRAARGTAAVDARGPSRRVGLHAGRLLVTPTVVQTMERRRGRCWWEGMNSGRFRRFFEKFSLGLNKQPNALLTYTPDPDDPAQPRTADNGSRTWGHFGLVINNNLQYTQYIHTPYRGGVHLGCGTTEE